MRRPSGYQTGYRSVPPKVNLLSARVASVNAQSITGNSEYPSPTVNASRDPSGEKRG